MTTNTTTDQHDDACHVSGFLYWLNKLAPDERQGPFYESNLKEARSALSRVIERLDDEQPLNA